jgi:hypothetical protein
VQLRKRWIGTSSIISQSILRFGTWMLRLAPFGFMRQAVAPMSSAHMTSQKKVRASRKLDFVRFGTSFKESFKAAANFAAARDAGRGSLSLELYFSA